MINKIKDLKLNNLKPKALPKLSTVILVLLSNAIITSYFLWINPKHSQANSSGAMAAKAIDVTVVSATRQQIQLFLELPGRVSANKISEVRPQIDGVIKQRKFVEGSFVKEGDQLYQIDPTIYQSALNSANTNYRALRTKKDRYKNLIAQDAISKQEFDDVNAAFASAQDDLKKAKTNLAYTKVRAPISGYIGKSNITEGALVSANQGVVLATITQLDPIYVDMAQPTKEAIQIGDQKEIPVSLISEDPSYQNIGTLKFSEVFADASTDSVMLRALFSNQDQKLIPGMFVNAKLHLKPFEAVTVPQRAANRAPNGSLIVWVVDRDNVAKPRPIKAEQTYKDSWIVIEGLEDGDVVVYEGFQKISDGAKVNPIFNPIVNSGALKIEEKK